MLLRQHVRYLNYAYLYGNLFFNRRQFRWPKHKRKDDMKRLTKALTMISLGLMFGAFITLNETLGLLAVGIFIFCYIYDEKVRRVF